MSNEQTKIVHHLYIYVIALIVILLVITVYKMIRPSINTPIYNFNAFPDVNLSGLTNVQSGGTICSSSLQLCDDDGSCAKCGDDNYQCINSHGNIVFNNMKVPKGSYCLPKGSDDLGCNRYTGRNVWTSTEGSEWKCECAYPELFTGPRCETQVACINSSVDATIAQPNNYLVGTTDGPYPAKRWDPINSDSEVLLTNPYTYNNDDKKLPWFKCNCDSGLGDDSTPFVNLPGDPYTCHLDPCWKSKNYIWAGADPATQTCECDLKGGFKALEGDFKGLCIHLQDVCQDGAEAGSYDRTGNKCNCTGSIPRTCTSNYVKRTDKNKEYSCKNDADCIGYGSKCDVSTGYCSCVNSNNKIGKECVNPCEPNPCNGRVCMVGSSVVDPLSCDCSEMDHPSPPGPSGSVVPPLLPPVYMCDTEFSQDTPWVSPEFGGARCTDLVWPDGAGIVQDSTDDSCSLLANSSTDVSPSDCKSGKFTTCTYSSTGFIATDTYCGDHSCPPDCVIL